MSAAHTPGPWETSSNGKDWDVCERAGGDMIADLRGCDNAEENARLIAAAPQLADDVARLSQALREIAMLPPSRAHEAAGIAGRALKKGAALAAAGVTP